MKSLQYFCLKKCSDILVFIRICYKKKRLEKMIQHIPIYLTKRLFCILRHMKIISFEAKIVTLAEINTSL